jgi:K+-sensing histidine kinase KdpD
MNDKPAQPKTTPAPARTRVRGIMERVLGRHGLVWAMGFTALATLLRWGTDAVLADNAPFSFYYLSVVLTALVSRMGSAAVAVILGGVCGHFLWVTPRFSFVFLDKSQVAQLVVYFVVATLCALAVALARILRVADYLDTPDD